MRIDFIVPSAGNSGGMQVIFKYAYELEKRGHIVNVYMPIVPYVLKRLNFFHKYLYIVPRIVLNIYRYKILNKSKKVCDKVHWKPVWKINDNCISDADVVIATAWPTAFDVARLSPEKGKKYYFIQGYEIWDDKEKGEDSYRLNLRKIVIADWIKTKIAALGVDTLDIITINNGIDFSMYDKKRHYNSSEKFRFLMLDHHLEKKGVKYGVRAYERIKKQYPDVSLKMFGLHRSENVPDNVDFYENPSRETIVDLYNRSDIFIFPSIEEGWGLTVVEAMASGCGIVGTNVGCLSDVGIHGSNCLKSKPKDISEMVKNIELLMNDNKLYKHICKEGKQTVRNLDWNVSIDKFEATLRNW